MLIIKTMSRVSYHPLSSASSTIYRTPISNNNLETPIKHKESIAPYFSPDPAKTGPGLWYRIHTSAALIALTGDSTKIDRYIEDLHEIVNTHNCGECRQHGGKFLRENPPQNYRHTRDSEGRLAGMFIHSWIFHNTVNARLGKDQLPYDTCWQMFSQLDNPTCLVSCAIPKDKKSTDIPTGHYKNYSAHPHTYENGYRSSKGYTVQYH